MIRFCEKLREEADPIWKKILIHPFINEIYETSLPIEKFRFYVKQDYPFLIQFARCLGVIIAKVEDLETMRRLASLLHDALTLEMEMLEKLGTELGIPIVEMEDTAPSPTNMAYQCHLLVTSYSGTVGEAITAMLPCMWSYQEIGAKFEESEKIKKHPLYLEWSAIYGTCEYKNLVKWYRGLVDKLGDKAGEAERKRMTYNFNISSKYEYMFWDMCYREEDWPV